MALKKMVRRIACGCLTGVMLASYIPVETFAENEEYIEEEAFLETIEALPDGGDPADAPERIDDLVSDTEFACEFQDDLFEDAEEPELPPEEGIEEDFSDLFSDIPEEETFDGDGAAIENETVMEEAETMADIAPPDPAAAAEITVGSEFMFSGSVETSKMYRFTASADILHVIRADNKNAFDESSQIHFELYDKDGRFLRAGSAGDEGAVIIRCILNAGESYYLAVTGACWGTVASYSYGIRVSTENKDFYVQRVGEEYIRVNPNEQVTMSVRAVSDCKLTYAWKSVSLKSTDDLDTSLPFGTEPSCVYTADKNRAFECTVSDADGCSESVKFEVTINNELRALTKNGTHNAVIFLKPNESITLEPLVSGKNLDELTYIWDDEEFTEGKSLSITPEEGGTYSCSVMDVYGNIDVARYEIRIENNFQAYPKGAEQYPDGSYYSDVEMYADPGDTLSLEVIVNANDKTGLTYEWYDIDDEQISSVGNASKMVVPYTGGCIYYKCHIADQYRNSETVSFFINPKLDVSSSGVIAENEKTAVTGLKGGDSCRIFSFTPRTTSAYVISSEEAVDNYIYLYDGNRVDQLAYNRRGEKGFLLQYNFAAGKTYYVKVGSGYEDRSDPLSFHISVARLGSGAAGMQEPEGGKPVPGHVHTFGAWTLTLSPTALAEGVMKRSCSCGAAETKTLPKLQPTAELNVSGTVPLKVKQKSKAVKLSGLAAGDFVKSASSDKAGIVNASVSGNTIALEAGKKTGTANVKITLGSGLTRSFKVKVSRKAVTTRKISVASRSVRLKKGKTFDLQTKLSPVTTSQTKIRYKTSNKKIAAVSSRGVIKAKAEGSAVITVKNGSKTVKVQVTVSK